MDVYKLGCKEFIQGKKKFIIPIYQRHYNWREQQCKQLFNDLMHLTDNPQNDTSVTHFFGSIFAMRKDEGIDTNVYVLIDGQQRITSIFLFYLAMYNAIQSQQIIISNEASKTELVDEIYNDILVDRHHPENRHLLLGENDRKILIIYSNLVQTNKMIIDIIIPTYILIISIFIVSLYLCLKLEMDYLLKNYQKL